MMYRVTYIQDGQDAMIIRFSADGLQECFNKAVNLAPVYLTNNQEYELKIQEVDEHGRIL